MLRSFDSADIVGLWAEPESPKLYEGLLESCEGLLAERECGLVVRGFEPATIPAFFALGVDAEFHRQLDRTKSMSSGLWNEILDALAPRPDTLSPTSLCLNSRNRLIQQLASLRDPELQRVAVRALYVQSLMSGQHALTARESEMLHTSMEQLLIRCADRAVNP